jgi:large subunit ribosomal protein L29
MKFKDMKGLSVKELNRKLVELKKELFQAKMKNQLGQLGNPVSIRFLRKDIARCATAVTIASKETP